jgi:hypothetical protein
MMSEYSDFVLVNRNTLGQYIFVGSHRMSDNSGVENPSSEKVRFLSVILLAHLFTFYHSGTFFQNMLWCVIRDCD